MSDLIVFDWWGNDNPPPENFKTKNQLSELGLSPKKARGVIHTNKYDLLLYDVNDELSVKPKKELSERQKLSIEKRKFNKWLTDTYHNYSEMVATLVNCEKVYYSQKSFLFMSFDCFYNDYYSANNQSSQFVSDIYFLDNNKEFSQFSFSHNYLKEIKENIIDFLRGKTVVMWDISDYYRVSHWFGFSDYNYLTLNENFWLFNRKFNGDFLSNFGAEKVYQVFDFFHEMALSNKKSVIDYYDNNNNIDRELLKKWFLEKYPNDQVFNVPKDTDLMLGNCYLCPDNYSVMLSPNSK